MQSMMREELILACCSDIAGKVRGKAFPAADLDKRLRRGIGWTPTNVQITCFDAIADSPYGALGDLLLIPEVETLTRLVYDPGEPAESFVLGNIVETDGTPWACCTRSLLRAALERLAGHDGLRLLAAFEHEFHFRGEQAPLGSAYTLSGYRTQRAFAEALTVLLRQNEIEPDTFMKEYGADQYEVTLAPAIGLDAADQAVRLREIVHGLAQHMTGSAARGASFTPLRSADGVGNGVHLHMSLRDRDDQPMSYDANGPHQLSAIMGSFAAGVLKYLPAFVALTAPSVVSYTRLTPHRWSAVFNNLGYRDREASLRICPTSDLSDVARARQFNLEFRASDAAASPYLQLAAIVHAGAQGIEEGLATPPASHEDLSLLEPGLLAARGYAKLPSDLGAALLEFERNETVRGWFGEPFAEVYLAHKRGELAFLADKSPDEICAAYETVY